MTLLSESNLAICGRCGGHADAGGGWRSAGRPVCCRCLMHNQSHSDFEPRCSLCWVERWTALWRTLPIMLWRWKKSNREIAHDSDS
jgi:hypothetical protein